MSDILKEKERFWTAEITEVRTQLREAKAEIERLRAALREIVRADPNADPTIYNIAREALDE